MSGLLKALFRPADLPERARALIESEGAVFILERVRVTVVYHRYRASGRSFSGKRETGWGSLALSGNRLLGYVFRKRVIHLPMDGPEAEQVKFSTFNGKVLCIDADVSAFGSGRQGRIELRYHTDRADELYSAVMGKAGQTKG